MSKRSVILGCGSYLPSKVLTNEDLSKIVDTNDEWITTRTGIKKRHIAAEDEFTSDMATAAAKQALANAGVGTDSIDLVIIATSTPDQTFPATAVITQSKLGIKQGAAFDVQAVCAGFVYGITTADSMLRAGVATRALVIGADKMSSILDWQDRSTCVLFGDGAGAVVMELQENKEGRGFISSVIRSDGDFRDLLYADGGVCKSGKSGVVKMSGQDVFKHAVEKMASSTEQALAQAALTKDDVTWFVPHQANLRILDRVAKKLGLPKEQVIATVDQHANTSAASIPLALEHATGAGKIKQGDTLALSAIGGGLAWGTAIVKW